MVLGEGRVPSGIDSLLRAVALPHRSQIVLQIRKEKRMRRIDVLLDLIRVNPQATSVELETDLHRILVEETEKAQKKGHDAEERIKSALERMGHSVRSATYEEDTKGFDLFMRPYGNEDAQEIPIQVKSSYSGLNRVKHQLHGRIIVNGGPEVADQDLYGFLEHQILVRL